MNYFSYSPHEGMQYHETKAEAKTAAEEGRKAMCEEGSNYALAELNSITWGEVTERVAEKAEAGYVLQRQDLLSYQATHPQVVDGRMENPYGDFIQVKNIKPKDLLIHDTVLLIAIIWMASSAKIKRFKGYALMEILALADILFEQHGVKRGGSEGNMEFRTYDGRFKLNVCIQKTLAFGPEIQVARQKMMQALDYYPPEADDLKAMVTTAYTQIDGGVRVAEILKLRNLNIDNKQARPIWMEALEIIAESLWVESSKKHLRLYVRNDQGGFDPIPLDIAAL